MFRQKSVTNVFKPQIKKCDGCGGELKTKQKNEKLLVHEKKRKSIMRKKNQPHHGLQWELTMDGCEALRQ